MYVCMCGCGFMPVAPPILYMHRYLLFDFMLYIKLPYVSVFFCIGVIHRLVPVVYTRKMVPIIK